MCPTYLALPPPPATRIARACPRCGGELRLWGVKRPRLHCLNRKACGWRGPPPVDVLLRRQGCVPLPGLESDEHQ
jgi:hypothetical protein